MAPTSVTYGTPTALRTNTFVKTGYTLAGWNAYRASDNKWYYTNGSSMSWYIEGSQPSGYTKYVYENGSSVSKTSTVDNDTVTMYAQWTANEFTVVYNANGGTGSMDNQSITYGVPETLTANQFTKTGYTFAGWYLYRASDQKWGYTNGTSTGFYTAGSEPSGYTKLFCGR
jgi:hypothetical protein